MNDIAPYRDNKLVALAREIAMDIHELPMILKQFGVEPDEFEKIKSDEFFQQTLGSMLAEWNSATNAEKRVRFKAAASIEEGLLELHHAAVDKNQPLNHRVLAMKFIADLAGLGQEEKTQQASGPGFSITINMGGQQQPLVIEGSAKEVA